MRIMDSEEGITVKYLPWSVGAHAGLGGPFTILGFDDPDDPSAVYFETHAGGKVADDEQELARFVDIFHEVERQALSIREYVA
jgi:hypothetical protein